ncbi:MAG: hypothetical protein MJB14_06175 [Spirochaetes bacterium]|nr:hypothetical protein [Spirochaetota bacterium]
MTLIGFLCPWFNGAGDNFSAYWFYSGIRFLKLEKYFVIPIYVLLVILLVLSILLSIKDYINFFLPTLSITALLAIGLLISAAMMNLENYGGLYELNFSFGLFILFPGLGMMLFGSIASYFVHILRKVLSSA